MSVTKWLVFLFGIILAAISLLWCLAGAGMYGSPLHGLGPELKFVVAYVACTAGMSLLGSLFVFKSPAVSAGAILLGSATASIIAGRYLLTDAHTFDLVGVLVTFVLPAMMALLGLLLRTVHRASTLVAKEGKTSPKLQFSTGDLMAMTLVVGLIIAHVQLSRPPDTTPSELLIDLGVSVPEPVFAEREKRVQARQDVNSILYDKDHITLRSMGLSIGIADRSLQMIAVPAMQRPTPGPAMDNTPNANPLVEPLRVGLLRILTKRKVKIIKQSDWLDFRQAERSIGGFNILYRDGDREGLIRATQQKPGNVVFVHISEYSPAKLLTRYPRRFECPWQHERDEILKGNRPKKW